MNKNFFNKQLFNFINSSTCSFTCINEIKKKLIKKGYIELQEYKKWNLKSNKYFVVRNDASIIAFYIGKKHTNNFNIICTHGDTPGFYLKPQNEIYEYNYLKLNVAPYGGILNYGWLDRPLSIAGRIICKKNEYYQKKIIDLKRPICIIPSEEIHINKEANTNLNLNSQIDMIPIITLSNEKNIIKKIIQNELQDNSLKIHDYDLFLYNKDKPTYLGKNNEMILSPRIDNLTCTFSAFKSFSENSNEKNINVLCVFNSEEIGSLSKEGADSTFLSDILKRISASINIDISVALHNSLIVSADNSHAVHPNHPNKSDVNNQGFLNNGILIIREKDTTTDSISSTIFKDICKKAKVPFQDSTSRNDMSTGSTLSGLSIRHVSIDSIDVGIPQLAMHSANELIGSNDSFYLYKAFKMYYNCMIQKENNSFKITRIK